MVTWMVELSFPPRPEGVCEVKEVTFHGFKSSLELPLPLPLPLGSAGAAAVVRARARKTMDLGNMV